MRTPRARTLGLFQFSRLPSRASPPPRSQGNGSSQIPDISNSGRFVTFQSSASNLVPGDTNGAIDIFVRDRKKGKTTRVSTQSDGDQANGSSLYSKISADGRFVVFESSASNLVPGDGNGTTDIFVKDRKTGKTRRVT
jgi:Tol biopolymer transport system component